MIEKRFSRQEALGFGWKKMKENFWFLMGIFAVMFFCQGMQSHFSHIDPKTDWATYFFGTFSFLILNIIIQMGNIRIALEINDGQKTGFDRLFSAWKFFFRYVAGSFLYSLIVLCGLILLVVPGIMWAIRFQFFSYFIIDKDAGPVEALKLSSKATKGARMDLFWFDLACFGAIILGVLALGIGIFVAIPTVMLAVAYVFRKLEPQIV